ncbi:MAG: MBL fold metallo-hydrolase [Patescibacteria group bacterium]
MRKKEIFLGLIKWRFMMGRGNNPWPKWVETPYKLKPNPSEPGLVITWINHSTVLIQMGGLNILTDPIWSYRASPVSWAGPYRVRQPGIRFEDLPPIDVVLISHNHYDHCDIATLKKLEHAHRPLVLAGMQSKTFLERKGMKNVQEFAHWDNTVSQDTTFTFVPAQHWSRRTLWDGNKMLWGGFIIQSKNHTVYFAGDTGFGEFIHGIHEQFPKIDVALLPIGSYEPRWFMKFSHINPDEAVQIHKILGAHLSIGIHYRTFRLGDDGYDEPIKDLALARTKYGLKPEDFITLDLGESVGYTGKTL